MYDPWDHVERIGFDVVYHPLRHCVGLYVPAQRVIALRPGMRDAVQRSVLAHELAHHDLGHIARAPGLWNDRQEHRANKLAASRLINPSRLADLARTTPDMARWAIELDVTGDLLLTHLNSLARAA